MGVQNERDVPTSEAAKLVGVLPDVLRKWKKRGFLKLAPPGVAGQGRGVECYWSPEAVAEAKAWAATPKWRRKRAVPIEPRPESRTALSVAGQGGDAPFIEDGR